MSVRLFIETATYHEMANWIWNLDEHGLIGDVADGGEITVRALGAKSGVIDPISLTLKGRSTKELAGRVKIFRTLSLARTAEDDGSAFTFSGPDEICDWPHVLKTFEEFFSTGLDRALLKGDAPYLSRELVSRGLTDLAANPDASSKLRAAIYTTLARLEEDEGEDE